ncbi:MAG: sigma-70 family RNA polymerase sigma factor [Verrucomicrobia bacterium]|nr:sigma-70 family RNA polymerase sigma factor [Verrucomicrobiota bacterium]
MPAQNESPSAAPEPHTGLFATTHWSVVLAAGHGSSSRAAEALERLCSTYWYPLYAHVRRRGCNEHDSRDLTQAFFAHLFQNDALHRVSREKGKFRSFLLASLNYFLADARDRELAQKRGGGREVVSFDEAEAEERYRHEPVDRLSPDRIFERRWALTMLDQVLKRLELEFIAAGKARLFHRLRVFLVEGAATDTYANAAGDLGLSEEAIKKAVQRLRRRYYELFRAEVANTVAAATEVDEELRYLCALMTDG